MGANQLTVGGSLMHSAGREPDFSGWATKFGIKCADGRTIHGGAFKDQDGMQVPLVYHHGHSDIGNVLGHAILYDRGDEGMYCDGFFNMTDNGQNAKKAVQHGDLKSLSIYANKLMEKSKQVMHGVIKEVSLVLSGANPGALIDQVQIAHGDEQIIELEDEAVIFIGEEESELMHAESDSGSEDTGDDAGAGDDAGEGSGDSPKLQEVFDNMSDIKKQAVAWLVGAAMAGDAAAAAHADEDQTISDDGTGPTLKEIVDSFTDDEDLVAEYMVGAALDEDGTEDAAPAADDTAAHSDTDNTEEVIQHMTRNVFEQNKGTSGQDLAHVSIHDGGRKLTHDDMKEIMDFGAKRNSMKQGLEDFLEKHELMHGIHSIETLFPEARNYTQTPEWDSRRMEWVKGVLDKVTKIPFSRVKTMTADITQDEARAKGYITGEFKEQEWFGLTHRETGPATIYKKQQLDRDDILDITDFDVVVWMKGEMRLMLEEELARAIIIGDGRSAGSKDKIKDPSGAVDGNGIRSILHDDDLYAKTETIKISDDGTKYGPEIADRILESLVWYKGTPGPTFYTTLPIITRIMLTRDAFGKRLWKNWSEFAQEIGCENVVAVEAAETEPDLIGIIVNLKDYLLGNDKGGEVNLFDDFDLNYNQFLYLIETRLSGALARIRSAIIIKLADEGDTEVLPVSPQFVSSTGVVTIPSVTGVTYKNAANNQTVTGAQSAIAKGATVKYFAVANDGYFFRDNQHDEYEFTRPND